MDIFCKPVCVGIVLVIVLVFFCKFSKSLTTSLHIMTTEIVSIDKEVEASGSVHEKSRRLIKDLAHARTRRQSEKMAVTVQRSKRRPLPGLPQSTWSESVTKKKGMDSAGERETRVAMENIFGTEFPKSRPNFLYNAVTSLRQRMPEDDDALAMARDPGAKPWPGTNGPFAEGAEDDEYGAYLELDCFSKTLLIACEFNGTQHYKFNEFFHGSLNGFHAQRYRDELKKNRCMQYGVRLIIVPYTVKPGQIHDFIVSQAKKMKLLDE
jgi:hypothetical protein